MLGIQNPKNLAKPIRLLAELERTGRCKPEFFWRIAEVLRLDEERLAELARSHEEKWQRALDVRITPWLAWSQRSAPTRFGMTQMIEHLPTGTPVPLALIRASKIARGNQVEVKVYISRRQCVVIDQCGLIRRVERQNIGVPLEPFTLNGRRFHLQRLMP
jgi:hypothetical protein